LANILELPFTARFLRRKFSAFVNDDPQHTQYSLKNKKARQQFPSTLGVNEGPSTSKGANLDLYQDSAMVCAPAELLWFGMPCSSQTAAVMRISDEYYLF
jgi:hypothetical protein